MVDGESVMRMRERGDGADLDILVVGEVRDIMRFVGAGVNVNIRYEIGNYELGRREVTRRDLQRIVCGVTRCEQP